MPIGAIAHPCLQLYSLAAKPMTQMSELVKERWPSMSEIELAKQKAQDIAARLLNNVDPMKRARVENGAGGGEEMTRVIWKLINEKAYIWGQASVAHRTSLELSGFKIDYMKRNNIL